MSDPINFDELFGGDVIVTLLFKNVKLRCHFVEKDAKTDLDYQHRFGERDSKGRPTDRALTAELWLFDQLCKKVEAWQAGKLEGEEASQPPSVPASQPGRWVEVPDFKSRVGADVKRNAVLGFFQRISREAEPGN